MIAYTVCILSYNMAYISNSLPHKDGIYLCLVVLVMRTVMPVKVVPDKQFASIAALVAVHTDPHRLGPRGELERVVRLLSLRGRRRGRAYHTDPRARPRQAGGQQPGELRVPEGDVRGALVAQLGDNGTQGQERLVDVASLSGLQLVLLHLGSLRARQVDQIQGRIPPREPSTAGLPVFFLLDVIVPARGEAAAALQGDADKGVGARAALVGGRGGNLAEGLSSAHQSHGGAGIKDNMLRRPLNHLPPRRPDKGCKMLFKLILSASRRD
eukprot:scaffold90350_cov48-Prasinocladus_malaysianus.AAC.6